MQALNFDTPVIDELGKVHPLKEYAGGGGGGDISDAIPVFTSDDTIQNPTEKVSMPLFQSGNALKDLLRWISKGFQNIRYLLKFTEDISTDLNTTIEKVDDINTNLVKEWTEISVARAGEYYWYNNLIWKALVDTANTPAEGSEWHNVKVMDEMSKLNSNINVINQSYAKREFLFNGDVNGAPMYSLVSCNATCSNLPKANTLTSLITIPLGNNPAFVHQIAFISNTADMYTRVKWGGNWGSWVKKI